VFDDVLLLTSTIPMRVRLLRPGHYDLLKPAQNDHPTGRPALSVDDLNRLCGEKAKAYSQTVGVGAGKNGDSGAPGSSSAVDLSSGGIPGGASVSVDFIQRLTERLRADYPSLLKHIIDGRLAADIPRVVLSSFYPALREMNGYFVHPVLCPTNQKSVLPAEWRIYALHGSDEELVSIARKTFSIAPVRELTLQCLSATAPAPTRCPGAVSELATYAVHAHGVVTVSVNVNGVIGFDRNSEFSRRYLFSEGPDSYFKVTVDLGLHRSAKDLISAFTSKLNLPTDCFTRQVGLMDILRDLSEAQMVDPGIIHS
jgi:hypothetical protein